MMGKLRIAITGATGLLGRNLLFEIIKQNLGRLEDLEVFVLGRRSDGLSLRERVAGIIKDDGCFYCNTDRVQEMLECIQPMEMDLVEKKLRLSQEDYKKLKSVKIDFFFHVAALTDFRNSPSTIKALYDTNVYGTKQILELASTLSLGEFCYVGSAYSCGKVSGNISPDYVKLDQDFRNPYEKTKLEGEMLVRGFEKDTGIRCRYFRPSTICGRLMESPLGMTCKFDVFYSWLSFFLRYKMKSTTRNNLYSQELNIDIGICYNPSSGLNIVPADYASKVICNICFSNNKNDSFHLVNESETPHDLYLMSVLKKYNFNGMRCVRDVPAKMNDIEKFYYKTVGKIFTSYINSEPMIFSAENIKPLSFLCPNINEKNLNYLTNYAEMFNYGL